VTGVIPRNFILVLIGLKSFYKGRANADDEVREERLDTNTEVDESFSPKAKESLIHPSINNDRTHSMGARGTGLQRKATYVNYTGFFDNDRFPDTPEKDILSWRFFTRDFLAKDLPVDDDIERVCREFREEMIDFRPYMIENPYTVFTTDQLLKCVDVFRKMHLRHLVVVHPGNCSLKGIITRKDLFKYLDL